METYSTLKIVKSKAYQLYFTKATLQERCLRYFCVVLLHAAVYMSSDAQTIQDNTYVQDHLSRVLWLRVRLCMHVNVD